MQARVWGSEMRSSPERLFSLFYRAGNVARRWRWAALALARATGSEASRLRIEPGEGDPVGADWSLHPGVCHREGAGKVLYRLEEAGGGCCEVREQPDAGSSTAAKPLRSVALLFQRGDDVCRLILWRRDRAGELDGAQLQGLASLLAHAVRAVRLGPSIDQARTRQAIMADALTQARRGVLLVTANGRIVYKDRCAEAWLSRDTAPFRDDGGRLRANDAALQESLEAVLQADVRQSVSDLRESVRIPDGADDGVAVQPVPVSEPTDGRRRMASIWPCRGEGTRSTPEPALRAQGLTPREAALACALASGLSIAEFATREGLSRSTVQTHLRSLFGKLHVNRQAEVVTHVRALSA